MYLSPNFTLDEMSVSQTAARRDIPNEVPAALIPELRRLAITILQPLRDHLGRPVVVTSGYRSPAVNAAVGGARNSAHMHGRAADVIVPGMLPIDVCQTIATLRLPFDQLIHEFGGWCHVAIAAPNETPRGERLTAVRGPSGTVYLRGIQ